MKITNSEIAKILYEIAGYLEMQNVAFKPRAYEKAAAAIEELDNDVSEVYKEGGLKALEEIPGVGVSIAEKVEELIKTGRLKYYNELKKKTPVDLENLLRIEGLGPKSVKKLYKKLKIKTVEDLEKAAKTGKIGKLEGFGKKSEENILKGIKFIKTSGNRFILGFVIPDLEKIVGRLKKLKEVERIDIVGSARREKETIGDCDILVIAKNSRESSSAKATEDEIKISDFFVNMPEVVKVFAHGETKSAIRLKNGMDVDLRVVPRESYGAALQYFTGSKDHNIAIREIAIKKGYKLNEYGLFRVIRDKRHETRIVGEDEKEIYEKLGMDWMPTEIRENQGEIELAQEHKLPKLINYGDLKGDLQIQTNWTDGANTIEEYAEEAIKMGLEYILITDHTKRLAMTGGLDEKKLLKQMSEIDKVNKRLTTNNKRLKILKGSEVDILKDGTMDIADEVLEKLDIVGGAIHSHFNLPRHEQTKRLIRAMENKNVDIIFHPTGRIINRRPAYDIDIDEIIKTAKRTGTILEIDAFPDRLDLKDNYIRKCVEAGVKLAIDSDAHAIAHMGYLEWGIAQARRGWATREDIINAWSLDKMLEMLK